MVIDVYTLAVIGWAMADHMRAELVCDALGMAMTRRRRGTGLFFHSDSEYVRAGSWAA